jgi:hypothetical protein
MLIGLYHICRFTLDQLTQLGVLDAKLIHVFSDPFRRLVLSVQHLFGLEAVFAESFGFRDLMRFERLKIIATVILLAFY